MTIRIGLYGGSFNPIHVGHLIVARVAAELLGWERVYLIPSGQPPHKRAGALLDGCHRAAMIRAAIADDPLFELDEHDLRQTGRCYTVNTVAHFAERLGAGVELHWLIGADSLSELATWHRVADLVGSCRVVTAARPGWEAPSLDALRPHLTDEQIGQLRSDILDTPRIDVSASAVRGRVADGLSIRYLVPESVRAYIETHGLYRHDAGGQ
ncbi:MAG: nicotinate (nicotinamide) nucleotide adenylyltransferase [Phycisphaerales bacterium]|nr:nicotinate (nicotinamide) nucleotide adenylyltransferase [Phycisphaerales bacterium]